MKARIVFFFLFVSLWTLQAQEAASRKGSLRIVRRSESAVQAAQTRSDVDVNIPQTKTENTNTYVLIFANQNYKYVADVPFALHDGDVFRQYCERTLGITGKNHIKVLNDATTSDMLMGLEWLKTALSLGDNRRAIVYYTGHGIPDERTKNSYLLPSDGNPSYMATAFSLNDFYSRLGETGKPVTVFLDACFSGAKRDEGMIVAAKAVALRAKQGMPQGRTVVFSAAQGEETAGFYREQQHGMFTYWLLKELQTSQGDINYLTLSNNLYNNVRQSSFDNNNKTQTPDVQSGEDARDWQTWTLK